MCANIIHKQLSKCWLDLIMHRKCIIYISNIKTNNDKTIIETIITDVSGMSISGDKYTNSYEYYSKHMTEYQYYQAYSQTIYISIPLTEVDIDLYDIILPISSKLFIYKPSKEEILGYKVTLSNHHPNIDFMDTTYNFIHNNKYNIIDNAINAYGIISLFSNENLHHFHITRNHFINLYIEHPCLNEIDYV